MKHNFVTCLKLLRGSGGGLYIDISKTQKFTEIYIFLSSNILMQITDQRLLSLHLHKVKLNYPRGQILIAPLKSLLSLYKQRRSQIRARAPVTLEGEDAASHPQQLPDHCYQDLVWILGQNSAY